ncbi:MAG: hypothetical protein EZS28_056571, partial [Streblomastix strix]
MKRNSKKGEQLKKKQRKRRNMRDDEDSIDSEHSNDDDIKFESDDCSLSGYDQYEEYLGWSDFEIENEEEIENENEIVKEKEIIKEKQKENEDQNIKDKEIFEKAYGNETVASRRERRVQKEKPVRYRK